MKKLIEFIKDKEKIFCYGIGQGGQRVHFYMKAFVRDIDGWIVSDGYTDKDMLEDIPIYELSSVPYTERDGIIIAVSSKFWNDVFPNIIRSGYRNVFILDGEERNVMDAAWKLSKHGCKMDNQSIEIDKKFLIPNLFCNVSLDRINHLDDMALKIYTWEMGDLIFPYLGERPVEEGPYEYAEVAISEGDIVLDCGANIGLFSAKAASEHCVVYAFEPVPMIAKYLEITQRIYKDNIHIIPKALADKNGKTKFCFDEDISWGMGHMGELDTDGNIGNLEVEVTTIDEFVFEKGLTKVDFIKADIEGAERMMLKGAAKTLKKFSPKLSLCTYHFFDDIQVLTNLILEANPNYKIVYAWRKLYAWVD